MRNIAITLGLLRNNEDLFSNGIKLNALYLMKLLKNTSKYNVFLVNTTSEDIKEYAWNINEYPIYHINERKDDIDVLISLGGQINESMSVYLKNKGVKLISYVCGDEYTWRNEHIIYNTTDKNSKLWYNPMYDEIWTVPQVFYQNRYFLKRMSKNNNVKTIPFIWNSSIIEEKNKEYGNKCFYNNNEKMKRIGIMEPNINMSKYCLYPLLIIDEVYEKMPEYIKNVYVNNTTHIRKNTNFVDIVSHLDVVKKGVATFEDRFDTIFFLSNHADIIVSHQWHLPLNYFYFDVVYYGYPLLHNASLCKEIGYYYDEFDGEEGSSKLEYILKYHDNNKEEYLNNNRKELYKYDTSNSKNIEGYITLIENIFKK